MPGKRKERINLSALTIIIHSSSKYESSQWALIKPSFVEIFWLNIFHIIQILLKKIILICTMKCWVRFWRSHLQKTKRFYINSKTKAAWFPTDLCPLAFLSLQAPVIPAVLSNIQPPASTLPDLPRVTGKPLLLCQLADTRLCKTAEFCFPYHRHWFEAYLWTF